MKRAACMRRDEERNTKLFYKLRCKGLLRKSSHLGTYINSKKNRTNIFRLNQQWT